jgi:hypothetical protein
MKSRLGTIALTALLTALLMNALSPWLRPPTVEAQSRFGSIQFTRSEGGWWFFDTRNGDLWIYDEARKMPIWHYRLKDLGAPLEHVSLTGKSLDELRGGPSKGAAPASTKQ